MPLTCTRHRAGPLTQGVPGATCVRIDQPANNRGGGNDESDGEDEPPVVFQFHFPPRGATSAHYYVVIVGRIPGIYITWYVVFFRSLAQNLMQATRDDTQDGQGARSQVSGVRNSCHQSFPTWDGAMDAWTQALDAGRVRATVNPEACESPHLLADRTAKLKKRVRSHDFCRCPTCSYSRDRKVHRHL